LIGLLREDNRVQSAVGYDARHGFFSPFIAAVNDEDRAANGCRCRARRHYRGTRLMRDTGDLDTVARVLGHRSIETARVYAKWCDQGAKTAIGRW